MHGLLVCCRNSNYIPLFFTFKVGVFEILTVHVTLVIEPFGSLTGIDTTVVMVVNIEEQRIM